MILNNDGLASALRPPAKIQLTKTLSIQNDPNSSSINEQSSSSTDREQSVMDYPLTPPPPILDHSHQLTRSDSKHALLSKRHSSSLSDWSVPPTSELSPTSLPSSSPDDSLVELDLKINQISASSSIKSRHRSSSFSCPILPHSLENRPKRTSTHKSKSLSRLSHSVNRKIRRSMSPVIKCSSVERLKRRRRDQEIYGKRLKIKTKSDEHMFIVQQLLNDIIE